MRTRPYVPWSAVYAVTGADGRGVLFGEDVPSDVSVIAAPVPDGAGEAAVEDMPAEAVPAQPAARRLQSVPAHAEPAADLMPVFDGGAAPRRRKRPQLRLVK